MGQGQVGNGDFLVDNEIKPDPGSFNPYPPSSDRNLDPRHYTRQVRQGKPPKKRPANTLYTGSDSKDISVRLALRNYIPDVGYDGAQEA